MSSGGAAARRARRLGPRSTRFEPYRVRAAPQKRLPFEPSIRSVLRRVAAAFQMVPNPDKRDPRHRLRLLPTDERAQHRSVLEQCVVPLAGPRRVASRRTLKPGPFGIAEVNFQPIRPSRASPSESPKPAFGVPVKRPPKSASSYTPPGRCAAVRETRERFANGLQRFVGGGPKTRPGVERQRPLAPDLAATRDGDVIPATGR